MVRKITNKKRPKDISCPICSNRLNRIYLRKYTKINNNQWDSRLVPFGWRCFNESCNGYTVIDIEFGEREVGNIEKLVEKLDKIKEILND